jgi:hypothetical protein
MVVGPVAIDTTRSEVEVGVEALGEAFEERQAIMRAQIRDERDPMT